MVRSVFVALWLTLLLVAPLGAVYAKSDLPDPVKPLAPQMNMARLEPPPLPAHPTQADVGAQRYWLHCQPCHGDQGQGLTDEWRAQYPPEEQNCWQAGCHGSSPNLKAFILPTVVPPVIGLHTLQRFTTAADLHTFLQHGMPYQAPGHLTVDDYWALTAFLLRSRGLPDSALPLQEADQVGLITLHPLTLPPTATWSPRRIRWLGLGLAGLLLTATAAVGWVWAVRHSALRTLCRRSLRH